jgi:hypothetical protein
MFEMCSKSALSKCSKLFDVALEHAYDTRISVRSASAATLMAMLNLNRLSPDFYPPKVISEEKALDAIRISIEMGLVDKYKSNIIKFFDEFDKLPKSG